MATGAHLPALTPVDIDHVPDRLAGGVVAVGNFDGIHRGHQQLLAVVVGEAARRGVAATVLTFEPHPRTVFRPAAPVFRLTPVAAKARLLEALGITGLVVLPFDMTLSRLTAGEFVERILVGRLRLAAAVVGFNFRFGRERGGSAATLAADGRRLGFDVTVVEPVGEGSGPAVASTRIRSALAAGDVAEANRLLGYRWFVVGQVARGDGRGRNLGFPTANLRLPSDCGLRHGIYAVTVRRSNGDRHAGVASFGIRPTFGGGEPLLEVFVFDFAADLYGEEVAVTFCAWLRPEEAFASPEALVAAMEEDSRRARAVLAAAGEGNALDRALTQIG